jgi:hypothetical protein
MLFDSVLRTGTGKKSSRAEINPHCQSSKSIQTSYPMIRFERFWSVTFTRTMS